MHMSVHACRDQKRLVDPLKKVGRSHPRCEVGGTNSSSLQEQQVLLMAEPSRQPQAKFLL